MKAWIYFCVAVLALAVIVRTSGQVRPGGGGSTSSGSVTGSYNFAGGQFTVANNTNVSLNPVIAQLGTNKAATNVSMVYTSSAFPSLVKNNGTITLMFPGQLTNWTGVSFTGFTTGLTNNGTIASTNLAANAIVTSPVFRGASHADFAIGSSLTATITMRGTNYKFQDRMSNNTPVSAAVFDAAGTLYEGPLSSGAGTGDFKADGSVPMTGGFNGGNQSVSNVSSFNGVTKATNLTAGLDLNFYSSGAGMVSLADSNGINGKQVATVDLTTTPPTWTWNAAQTFSGAATLDSPITRALTNVGAGMAWNGSQLSASGDGSALTNIADSALASYLNVAGIPTLALWLSGDMLTNYAVGDAVTNANGYGLSATSTVTDGPRKVVSPNTGRYGLGYYGTNYLSAMFATSLNSNATIFIAYEATNRHALGDKYLFGGRTSQLLFGDGLATDANRFVIWFDSTTGLKTAHNFNELQYPRSLSNTVTSVSGMLFEKGTNPWPLRVYQTLNEFTTATMFTNRMDFTDGSQPCIIGSGLGGVTSTTYGFRGIIHEVIVFTNAIASQDYARISTYLRKKYQVRTPPYYMADGDMGFVGGAMGVDEKFVSPVMFELSKMFLPCSQTISASTVRTRAAMENDATNAVSAQLQKSYSPMRSDNLYLLYYGGREMVQGTNGADAWWHTSNAMFRAKSAGWKVPVFTQLPNGSNEVERATYNASARQYAHLVGNVLVDLESLPFTNPTDITNSLYYASDTASGYVPTTYFSKILTQFITEKLRTICTTNLIP